MKKLLALLLAVFMVISLCACDTRSSKNRDDDDETTEATGTSNTVAGDEGTPDVEGNDTGITTPEIPTELPFKSFSANVTINANGEKTPCVIKMDLENLKGDIALERDGVNGYVAIDENTFYVLAKEDGEIIDAYSVPFEDVFPTTVSDITGDITEEQLTALLAEVEGLIPVLEGKKDFDISTVADILKALGVEMPLDDLFAELGITAQQAESIVNSVLDLITDPEWLAKHVTIKNTIDAGTGTFSLNGDISTIIYDLMAAVGTEMGEEIPSYEESGITAMPVDFSITLKNNIPTDIDFSFADAIVVKVTNKLTDNSIDLDISITADGEEFAISIDGMISGDTATLTVDLTSGGMKVRIFDLTAQINESKVAISMAIGTPGERLSLELDIDIKDGKPTTFEAGVSVNGETSTFSGEFFDFDNTTVDISDIKEAVENAEAEDEDEYVYEEEVII